LHGQPNSWRIEAHGVLKIKKEAQQSSMAESRVGRHRELAQVMLVSVQRDEKYEDTNSH